MISDLFPAHERGTAMAIFAVGINLGLLIAYLGGGWMSEHWGWRTTLIVVGLPGLLIALVVRYTLVEPLREAPAKTEVVGEDETASAGVPLKEVVRYMSGIKSLRHVILGGSLSAFVGYGMVLWLPAFFTRSHDLSQTEVGMTLAVMTGVVGGLGTFTSGRLADVLARRDPRWNTWVIALSQVILLPFLIAFFLMEDLFPALAFYLVPAFFGGFYLGPGFAMIQGLVPARMRAVAASINLFLVNMIGLGLGPQGVGILSDLFAPVYGSGESLRYALLVFGCVNLWSALHYYLASRTLRRDLTEAVDA